MVIISALLGKSSGLVKILEYSDYRNFLKVVDKAKIAYTNSSHDIQEHFVDITQPQKSHFKLVKKRKTIQDIWGTMPERLPASDHIKEAKKRMRQQKKLGRK